MSTRAVVAAVIAAACLTPATAAAQDVYTQVACARRGERVTELRQHQRRRHPY